MNAKACCNPTFVAKVSWHPPTSNIIQHGFTCARRPCLENVCLISLTEKPSHAPGSHGIISAYRDLILCLQWGASIESNPSVCFDLGPRWWQLNCWFNMLCADKGEAWQPYNCLHRWGDKDLRHAYFSQPRSLTWAWKHIKGHTFPSQALSLPCSHPDWSSSCSSRRPNNEAIMFPGEEKQSNYIPGQVPGVSFLVCNYCVVKRLRPCF